jgi:uncharacterized protein
VSAGAGEPHDPAGTAASLILRPLPVLPHPAAEPISAGPRNRWSNFALVAALVVAGLAILRLADSRSLPQVQNFILVSSSLLIEAFPFILFGALVGATIEYFVPPRAFDRFARLPKPLQMPLAALGGFAFPVCECGSVPVARRLVVKGFSPQAAVTFMLAAPILNPVVLWSTAVAYQGRSIQMPMLLGRAGLGMVVAIIVGWSVGRRTSEELLRTPTELAASLAPPDAHDHPAGGSRLKGFLSQVASDFIGLGKYLVMGIAVAAAVQTFVPQSVIGRVGATPVLSILAMMGLAIVLSLCSESDAFVAASFSQFGLGAQLGFLVIGPMIDTKLGFLYVGTFGKEFLRTMVITSVAATLVGCIVLQVVFG